jgi:hypothetical protein
MTTSSQGLHESSELLTRETRDHHRAIVSLQEELEAVDWYRQRADACDDDHLREILLHNMREEIEHACMVLEWLRRTNADFDAQLRTYLFTEGPIHELEEEETGDGGPAPAESGEAQPAPLDQATIGSLKEK